MFSCVIINNNISFDFIISAGIIVKLCKNDFLND